MKRAFCIFLFLFSLVGVLSVSAAQNVVSIHKGYTLFPGASLGYPDDHNELTNGKYGTPVENGTVNYYYRDTEYVGFKNENGGEITVILDLGESYSQLFTFEVSYLHETEVGIYAPAKIAFYLGEKEEDYTFLGELTPNTQRKAGVASLEMEKGLSGRFVKVVITPGNGAWTFLDEITVLQGQNPLSVSPPPAEESMGRSNDPAYGDTSAPQTGDSNLVIFVLLCAVSAMGTFALLGRRRFE